MSAVDVMAAGAAEATAMRLAERLGEALPGVEVARVAEGVAVRGRGLSRRLAEEPALRWPAGVLR